MADFKAAQNIQTTADDAWIQQLITRASAWVENATNRKFVARQYNGNISADATKTHATTKATDEDYWYIDGDPSQKDQYGYGLYYLPQYPIQQNTVLPFQLAALQSRDNVATTGDVWDTTSLLEGRDYLVDRNLGAIRLLSGPFALGMKNYLVTYAAGYQLGNQAPWVPADLQQLCIEMVNLVFRDKANLKAESIGTWRREFDTAKENPFVSATLGAYQRLVLV